MSENGEMPFLDHLEELRRRLLICVAAVGLGAVLGLVAVWFFDLPDLLLAPLNSVLGDLRSEGMSFGSLSDGAELYFLSLTEPFFFLVKMGVLGGVVLASPVLVYQAWAFLAPALTKGERKAILPTMSLGVVLFASGVTFAYFLVLEPAIRFFLVFGAEWFTPALTAEFYLSFVSRTLVVFGLAFELPVVLMLLTALGVVTPTLLREKRRHAVVAVTILAAMMTPGDAFFVTLMLMGPMIVLYEFGIVCSRIVSKKKAKDEAPVAPEDSISFNALLFLTAAAGAANKFSRVSRRPV